MLKKNNRCKNNICISSNLYKENNLSKFDPQEFDYIILDETHHAADTNITYDNIIEYFRPKYL